jgi:ATP phosphoribosyltransferase regulatory subunit
MSGNEKNDQKILALLPAGFTDLLPPDAEGEAVAISKLMGNFAAFGYQRVKPPLLEFEDSLFAPGPGAAMADQSFRVMDPVSHRMMGLRSDITPQIARISSSRLKSDLRPLRLCYANDALRTKASQQRTERQFTQVGCEIVGEKSLEADIESCVVALIGLSDLGLKRITIDLAYPGIVENILKGNPELKSALEKRDASALKKTDKKTGALLVDLMGCAGPADAALKKLSKISLSAAGKSGVKDLKFIHQGVRRAIDELNIDATITIDPTETRGFKYYSGFGFTLFAHGIPGELGRGGRYDVLFGVQKPPECAAGFTLYMDTVRKSMPPTPKKKIKYVGYGENWKNILGLQKKNFVVVRGKKSDQ